MSVKLTMSKRITVRYMNEILTADKGRAAVIFYQEDSLKQHMNHMEIH